MAYKFMLGVLPLPIPPSSLEISTPSTNKVVTLIDDGEINIPKQSGLKEISFDFLLPTYQKYPFADYQIGNYTAPVFIQYIKYWKEWCMPIPFIVVRMSPKGKFMYFTSILCLIEDFTFNEDAEEYGCDTNCSIKLKQYKPYGTKRVKVKEKNGEKTASVKNTRSTADRVKKSEIKPKEGESLISASKREGYNPSDVFEANGIAEPTIDYDSINNNILETQNLAQPEFQNPLSTPTNEYVDVSNTVKNHLKNALDTASSKVGKISNATNKTTDFIAQQIVSQQGNMSYLDSVTSGLPSFSAPIKSAVQSQSGGSFGLGGLILGGAAGVTSQIKSVYDAASGFGNVSNLINNTKISDLPAGGFF